MPNIVYTSRRLRILPRLPKPPHPRTMPRDAVHCTGTPPALRALILYSLWAGSISRCFRLFHMPGTLYTSRRPSFCRRSEMDGVPCQVYYTHPGDPCARYSVHIQATHVPGTVYTSRRPRHWSESRRFHRIEIVREVTQSNPRGKISVDRGTVAALSTNNTMGMLVRLSRICRIVDIQK